MQSAVATNICTYLTKPELLLYSEINPDAFAIAKSDILYFESSLTPREMHLLAAGVYGITFSQTDISQLNEMPTFSVKISQEWITVSPKINKFYSAALGITQLHLNTLTLAEALMIEWLQIS